MRFPLGAQIFSKKRRGKNVFFSVKMSLISRKISNQITEDCTQIKQYPTDIFSLAPMRVSLYPECTGGPEQTPNQGPRVWFLQPPF